MSPPLSSNKFIFFLSILLFFFLLPFLSTSLTIILLAALLYLIGLPSSFLSLTRKSIEKYDLTYSEDPSSMDKQSQPIVDIFYNIVTDFYEYGWGDAFHFAARFKNESFKESIARHEYFLALKLGLNPKDKVYIHLFLFFSPDFNFDF
jgi:hypothetical protein